MELEDIRRFRRIIRRYDRLRGRQLKSCCGCVTPAQCHILLEIEAGGPITSGELARRLEIDPSTLSRTADRLVERGLVVRESCPSDRRALLVALTPEGAALCERLNLENDAHSRTILAGVPADRRLAVLEDFELLVEAMSGFSGPPTRTKKCDQGG